MYGFLSGNALKILAAIAMVCDHAGLMFFPKVSIFRVIGRLAYPIFAFMIAEGTKYTRNKAKYFGGIFLLAVVCQVVYWFVDGSLYLSILFTFSLAIGTIYTLQFWKQKRTLFSFLVFAAAVAGVWVLNQVFTIDYGFWGCMVPVFAAAFHNTKYDRVPVQILMLGAGLLLLSGDLGSSQYYSLLALPLLFCYSGQRGKRKMKYFFYIFYPGHLAALQVIAWILG